MERSPEGFECCYIKEEVHPDIDSEQQETQLSGETISGPPTVLTDSSNAGQTTLLIGEKSSEDKEGIELEDLNKCEPTESPQMPIQEVFIKQEPSLEDDYCDEENVESTGSPSDPVVQLGDAPVKMEMSEDESDSETMDPLSFCTVEETVDNEDEGDPVLTPDESVLNQSNHQQSREDEESALPRETTSRITRSNLLHSRCSKKSKTTKDLKVPSGEKPYKCELCDYRTAWKGNLKHHFKIHSEEKPFSCPECSYRAANASRIRLHMRMHTGEKPYSCNQCDYRTSRTSTLAMHMKRHTGEKPLSCDQCDYRTLSKSHLDMHIMNIHTDYKLYKCDQCDYGTNRRDNLANHYRNHTNDKPYGCTQCDYRTTKKSNMTVHLKKHTGEKPFSCSFCDFVSAYKSRLQSHTANKHTNHLLNML